MYNLLNLAMGFVFVSIGLHYAESGWLWSAALIVGGAYIGHALTEALNTPSDNSDNSGGV